ncbi:MULTISPECIES: hypothetical protein [unclassified Colwellia]|uniref:hypothetical protein n=1 Tax=unclassified Colwellia TaxID=196834 RepID=UPI0015F3D36E|nr:MULTISPECIES: hypothetical protein [unclassified Colwellia]MBA6350412.1 hypothetical protein [Colwellia sp. BRX8-9]MBA6379704.1 hypothetical protein [Colwellia sp. BRX10-7]MBA6389048.1 hypothetical protein [Colwellia sp. BRX10-2]MBA6402781.1 hypothetical protein [Colwellia sp. BRX10-5]MBA6406322.1 hypothetical protein [Colwellia sp. BRX10-1]
MDSFFYYLELITIKLLPYKRKAKPQNVTNKKNKKVDGFINTLNGRVSSIRVSNSTFGLSDMQLKDYTFRIDGTPVEYRSKGSLHIENGDEIKAIGNLSKGLLKAYAVKNLNTGVSKSCFFVGFFELVFFTVSVYWCALLAPTIILVPLPLIPAYIFGKRILKRTLSTIRINA